MFNRAMVAAVTQPRLRDDAAVLQSKLPATPSISERRPIQFRASDQQQEESFAKNGEHRPEAKHKKKKREKTQKEEAKEAREEAREAAMVNRARREAAAKATLAVMRNRARREAAAEAAAVGYEPLTSATAGSHEVSSQDILSGAQTSELQGVADNRLDSHDCSSLQQTRHDVLESAAFKLAFAFSEF